MILVLELKASGSMCLQLFLFPLSTQLSLTGLPLLPDGLSTWLKSTFEDFALEASEPSLPRASNQI